MSTWAICAVTAGLGAMIGVAVGDLLALSSTVQMLLAGIGGGVGALVGSYLTRRPEQP